MKIVVFNGPPRCGKDTAAEVLYAYLSNEGYYPIHLKMSAILKATARAIIGELSDDPIHVWEQEKDSKLIPGLGITYRQLQIDISEKYFKPVYGDQIFGRLYNAAMGNFDMLASLNRRIFICSDGGFEDEIIPLRKAGHAVTIVHVERRGHNFDNDSRSYIDAPQWFINNAGSLEEYKDKVRKFGHHLLYGKDEG